MFLFQKSKFFIFLLKSVPFYYYYYYRFTLYLDFLQLFYLSSFWIVTFLNITRVSAVVFPSWSQAKLTTSVYDILSVTWVPKKNRLSKSLMFIKNFLIIRFWTSARSSLLHNPPTRYDLYWYMAIQHLLDMSLDTMSNYQNTKIKVEKDEDSITLFWFDLWTSYEYFLPWLNPCKDKGIGIECCKQ